MNECQRCNNTGTLVVSIPWETRPCSCKAAYTKIVARLRSEGYSRMAAVLTMEDNGWPQAKDELRGLLTL